MKRYRNVIAAFLLILAVSGCGQRNPASSQEDLGIQQKESTQDVNTDQENVSTQQNTFQESAALEQETKENASTGEASEQSEASQSENADNEAKDQDIQNVPALGTSYLTEEMYERATSFSEGDFSRLANVMRKAQKGEAITVAVIGGSITEGYSSSSKDSCYAAYFYKWWTERFPDTKVNYVNAGVGGTSSYLGVHRVQEDVLDHDPDVVVVEFSVNDGTGFFYKKSYDNLVRRILKDDQDTAVILLFTTQENGTNAQADHALIGFQYQLPMLSYGNAVLPAIEAGEFAWSDISPDNVHPNDRGHAVIGEMFYRYLNDVYGRLDEVAAETAPFTVKPVTKETYQTGVFLGADDIEPVSFGSFEKKQVNWYFPDNWHTEGGEEALVFEVEASHIGLVYQRMVDKNYGKFEIYIDGTSVRTLDGYFENGWGSATEAVEIYASDETAVHTIEIRKSPESEGDLFTLIGLLVSQV